MYKKRGTYRKFRYRYRYRDRCFSMNGVIGYWVICSNSGQRYRGWRDRECGRRGQNRGRERRGERGEERC